MSMANMAQHTGALIVDSCGDGALRGKKERGANDAVRRHSRWAVG